MRKYGRPLPHAQPRLRCQIQHRGTRPPSHAHAPLIFPVNVRPLVARVAAALVKGHLSTLHGTSVVLTSSRLGGFGGGSIASVFALPSRKVYLSSKGLRGPHRGVSLVAVHRGRRVSPSLITISTQLSRVLLHAHIIFCSSPQGAKMKKTPYRVCAPPVGITDKHNLADRLRCCPPVTKGANKGYSSPVQENLSLVSYHLCCVGSFIVSSCMWTN